MIWKQNSKITNEYVRTLASELGVNELLLRIFLNRVNDKESARIALRDINEAIIPPEYLVNGKEVAQVIAKYIRNGWHIFIHADYDSDGLNSGYLMHAAISEAITHIGSTATVEVYFPLREHGYGLSMFYAEKIVEFKSTTDKNILVITVDNGIAQVEQVEYLMNNGIEVVVTDHHQSKDEVPNCLICDPHNAHVEQDDTFHHLCGAGVAFKVCELMQKELGYHDMYKYVPNVAIATVTDVMPLNAENMAFIKYGLDIINSSNCPAGIGAMKEFLGIELMNPAHIAWEIGPRLNACGRMSMTSLGGKLLTETDYDMAVDLVNEIELINEKRKELTKKAMESMNKMNFDNDLIAFVVLEEMPEGIVGIIAGRAVEKFNKPAFVVVEHDGLLKGSSRSIPGIDILSILKEEEKNGTIKKFGGHAEAAGVQIYEEKQEEFIQNMNKHLAGVICTQTNDETEEEKILNIDECIEIKHLNKSTFDLINHLPYDKNEFTTPVFALTDCTVKDYLPTKSNPDNLWLTVQQGNQSVKFWCKDMTSTYKQLGCPKVIHLAGYIEKNFMAGRPYTMKIIDILNADAS